MSKEEEIHGQRYKIDYSYFDFRPMGHQMKLDVFLVSQDEIENAERERNLEQHDCANDKITTHPLLIKEVSR